MNIYIALYNGKKIELFAMSYLDAHQWAVNLFNAEKPRDVSVRLKELVSEQALKE